MKTYICIGAVVFLWCIAGCVSITAASYTLETEQFTPESSATIILIADLHSTVHGKNQKPLIQKIQQRHPDIILLAGDIVDDIVPITGTQLLLAGIKDTAPIYYVTGNHEYLSSDIQAILQELESFGVKILSDRYEQIEIRGNTLIIAGIEDQYKKLYEPGYNQVKAMEAAFAELETIPGYKILIAHRPELINQYRNYPFDLVVSGHAHGGQIRIPLLLNGLYAPNQGLFPKYAGGLYTHGTLSHIVSRGLSINPLLPRIFNPPELVCITVTSGE